MFCGEEMNEMIKIVARAICRAGICGPKSHLDEQVDKHWRKFEIEAKAAVKAMREPTSDMIADEDLPYSPAEMLEYWQAMIDAALKDD